MPLRAFIGLGADLDRWIIGCDLLRPGIIRLQLLENHRTRHTGRGIFSGLRHELALGDPAMHIAVENLKDALIEILGLFSLTFFHI